MDNSLPYFYYDILSRIIPGATTLAVSWSCKDCAPIAWLHCFVETARPDGWEKLLIPFLLLGIAYVIGVIFEVIDYSPGLENFKGMKWVSDWIDNTAFRWALSRSGDKSKTRRLKTDQLHQERDKAWYKLMYEGGVKREKTEMNQVFAHCHRFQAEQKMFQHLFYATLIFEVISVRQEHWSLSGQDLIGALALFFFAWSSFARSRRRWQLVLAFSEIAKEPIPADKS